MNVLPIIVKGLVALLFIGTLVVFIWAYYSSKGRFDDYIEPLDENEFKLKKFLPIGLHLGEKIRIANLVPGVAREIYVKYTNDVAAKLTELYGYRYSQYYIEIHNASKWSIFLIGLFACICFAGIYCLKNNVNNALIFAFISPLIGIGLAFLLDKELNDKIEARRLSIQLDFPEFINKLLLLVNAGMTISRAWEKIITENKKKTPLYKELDTCLAEIKAGKPEAVAYEDFARRCKIREIIRFVSVIILNLRKGGAEVVPTLRAQSDECWEMRKNAARRLGEQASSKLMLPMAIMLLGIIMIVALPAVLQLAQ